MTTTNTAVLTPLQQTAMSQPDRWQVYLAILAGAESVAGSPILLPSPNGMVWGLSPDTDGSSLTNPLTPVLQSPNGTKYAVTAQNDGSILTTITTATVSEPIYKTDADGDTWLLGVEDDGSIIWTEQ